MTINVQTGQCMADIAIQTTGNLQGLFSLCIANNLLPDEVPSPGNNLTTSAIIDEQIAAKYARFGWKPASAKGYPNNAGQVSAFSTGFSLGFNA